MRVISHHAFARFLHGLAGAVCRHARWFVFPQLLLACLSLLYATSHLKFDMDRGNLIGPESRSHRNYLAVRREFPGEGDELVVVVESGRGERNRQFVERLAARIRPETNLFSDLFYKADLTTLGPKGLMLASTNDLEEMSRKLREARPVLDRFSQATNLNSLFGLVNRQFRLAQPSSENQEGMSLVQALPMLQSIVAEGVQAMVRPGRPPPPEVEAFFVGDPQAVQQIYITVDGGRMYLLTARPRSEAVTASAIERMRALVEITKAEVPGLSVGLTGGPVLDYDEMQLAERDTARASLVATLLCLVLFTVAYRQLGRPLKTVVCLLIGLGYALGFATLAIGHLNILTVTFAPMLIGLSIDFGIHFISRYEEEVRNRHTESEAVDRAMTFTGQGIVTGGLTTAAAFWAMVLTQFKGIREMGVISGGGLLLCLIPMMTALPVLLRHGRQNARDREMGPLGQKRLQIEFLWLGHPALLVTGSLILCLCAAFGFRRISFDYDLLHMQSQSLPSVIYEKKLIQSAGASSRYGIVLADSPAQALEFGEKLRRLPAVAEVRSAADFVGPDQDRKIALVRNVKRELAGVRFAPVDRRGVQPEELSATLWSLTGYLGLAAEEAQVAKPGLARQLLALQSSIIQFRGILLRPQPQVRRRLTEFQRGLFEQLHRTIEAIQNQDTSGPLNARDLPPSLRDRFLGRTGKYLVQVYPRKDLWEHRNQEEFIRELRSVIPPQRVAGTPLELYEYTTLLKNSYEQAALYAFAAIVLMVLLHFRSFLAVGLTLLPVAIGTLWLIGFMGLTGVPFNPANIMTLPLVLGIGVTNGVQILNRFAEERQPAILAKSTGKAVLVSGLTAIAGFGSLILASHQGIRSLGIIMSVGIAACMIAALAVLPALLGLLLRRGWL